MSLIKNKPTKHEVLLTIKNLFFVLLGCTLVAFGDVAFLVPCNIVSGGVSGLAIVIDYLFKQAGFTFDTVDVTIAILQVVCFIAGLIVLGKKFSIHTLIASIAYPVILSLFYRFHVGDFISNELIAAAGESEDLAKTLLSGIFGGFLVGAGVACAFLGEGSTGGFDILSAIIARYTEIKQDVSSFIIDGTIIIIGAFCMWGLPNEVSHVLIGLISASCCAASIQLIYIYMRSYIIADIISDRYEDITEFIHVNMDHGTTIIDTIGGYTGEDRKLIRVAFKKSEMSELKSYIGKVDPKAFVTFTNAFTVAGEGFLPLNPHNKTKRKKRRFGKKKPPVPTGSDPQKK